MFDYMNGNKQLLQRNKIKQNELWQHFENLRPKYPNSKLQQNSGLEKNTTCDARLVNIKRQESANENERRKHCLKRSIMEDGRDGHFFSHAILSAVHVSSLVSIQMHVSVKRLSGSTGVSPPGDAAQ